MIGEIKPFRIRTGPFSIEGPDLNQVKYGLARQFQQLDQHGGHGLGRYARTGQSRHAGGYDFGIELLGSRRVPGISKARFRNMAGAKDRHPDLVRLKLDAQSA